MPSYISPANKMLSFICVTHAGILDMVLLQPQTGQYFEDIWRYSGFGFPDLFLLINLEPGRNFLKTIFFAMFFYYCFFGS